jgi:hypothetical protein
LRKTTPRLTERLAWAIAFPIDRDAEVLIEIDPWSFAMRFCAAEEALLDDDWAVVSLERPPDHDAIDAALLFPWIAECWKASGGPARFRGAVAAWHGFAARFDLDAGAWREEPTNST